MGRRGRGEGCLMSKDRRVEGCQGSLLVVAVVPSSGCGSGVVVPFLGEKTAMIRGLQCV